MTTPFKIDGVYCLLIQLTQGQYAIVDAADYEWISRRKWYAHWNKFKKSFYASRNETLEGGKRITVFMHREILGLKHGDPEEGDHISTETLDNRRKNLRVACRKENMRNIKAQINNKLGIKGVYFEVSSGKYVAQIQIDGKRKKLGRRQTALEAQELYKSAALFHYGDFARAE